jgi:hypothetical protein
MARTYVVMLNPSAEETWEVEAGSVEQAIRLCGEAPGRYVAVPKRNLAAIRKLRAEPKPPPLTMERIEEAEAIHPAAAVPNAPTGSVAFAPGPGSAAAGRPRNEGSAA